MSDKDTKLCLNGCFTIKPVSEFAKHPRSPDGLNSRCKPCELERVQRHRHGMTAAEKALIATEQGGCAICHRPEPGAKGWVIDHDHACCPGERSCTECRRGVLCQWCNAALGYAGDDPAKLRAMADYLESGKRIGEMSVKRLAWAIQSTDSHTEDHRRRTDTASYSPSGDNSPSVTRTRTYGRGDGR